MRKNLRTEKKSIAHETLTNADQGYSYSKFLRYFQSFRIFSLLEQGIISVTNFTALIVLARLLTKDEFGIFALAFTIAIFVQGFQRAMISLPLVTFNPVIALLRKELSHWTCLLWLLSITLSLLLGSAWFISLLLGVESWLQQAFLGAAVLIVPLFAYEFLRRYAFIEIQRLLRLAVIAALYSLSYLSMLIYCISHTKSAFGGIIALAGASLLAAILGFWQYRLNPFTLPRFSSFFSFLGKLGSFWKWAVLSHVAYSGYNYANMFILSAFSGSAGAAIYSATRNLAQPLVILQTAIDNIDKPRASRALFDGGFPSMARSLWDTAKLLIVLGLAYSIVMALAAPAVLHIFYAGKYDSYVIEVILWLGGSLLLLVGQPLESGLYILKRPDLLFQGRLWATVVSIIAALLLIPSYGVRGALVAFMVGWLASLSIAFFQLYRLRSATSS
jgi:O-antigen/teichoic acid export membrane protein